jgi:hypothetical protein
MSEWPLVCCQLQGEYVNVLLALLASRHIRNFTRGSCDHSHGTAVVRSRAAGGFDHGGHSLYHGGTTSMAAGPDVCRHCAHVNGAILLSLFLSL